MILAHRPLTFPLPTKFIRDFSEPITFPLNIFSPNSSVKATWRCCCSSKEKADNVGFSVLQSDVPWDKGTIWSTMGSYFFGLHIPLSYGGLSVVAQLMHRPVLEPQIEAVSILLIQSMELWGALALLRYAAAKKPQYKFRSFFQSGAVKDRNWVQASILGFMLLISVALVTSFLADRLIGTK